MDSSIGIWNDNPCSPVASVEPNVMSDDARLAAKPANLDGSPISVAPFGGDRVVVMDGVTGEIRQELAPDFKYMSPELFSPDGERLLISCSENSSAPKTFEIWNLQSARLECRLTNYGKNWWPLGFSPNGKTLAMIEGSLEKELGLWDTSTGNGRPVLQENLDYFRSLAFSPDSRWLAVGGGREEKVKWNANYSASNGEVHLWDLAQNKKCSAHIDTAVWGVTALAFSPDGKTLAVGDSSGNIRLLDVAKLVSAK